MNAQDKAWFGSFVGGVTSPKNWEWRDLFNLGFDHQQKKIDRALDLLAKADQTETVIIVRAALDE